ncbi:MAG: hypothetical protein R3272_03790 [Candidatus Promineifilaceae bacterium]|nr:hypothetical protein [Candidatus Promineifilaceae bacterium]
MTKMRRAVILKLAAAAYEMDLDVNTGVLQQDEKGRWQIGERDLLEWLSAYAGEEIVLVMGSLDDEAPIAVRTCRTCGRDYTDLECPTCRANRIRLRGR